MIRTLAGAAVLFWLAFDGGTYALDSRAPLAIAIWWTVLLAVVLGLWPLARPPRAALLVGGLLAAFGVLTASSIAWAESAERAFTEFNRVALYLGVFAVAVLAGTRGTLGRWLDAIAIAVSATGILALTTRLFPDELPAGEVPEFLPTAATRLSYPVEYWNGLAILVAIALPLLLRAATESHSAVWRGLAVGVVPALSATMYLTSSRGGFATALVGVVAFLVLAPVRWPAVSALVVSLVGSGTAIATLLARNELVNDPFDSPLAVEQGRSAALIIALVCLAAGVVYGLGTRFAGPVRIPALAGRVATILVVLAALVGVAASDPVERFEAFKEPPGAIAEDDFVRAHLLSGSGSGRWQFWQAAVDAFETKPLAGRGAGSYEAWWAQHGTVPMFVRDAHSLYLETLAELGLVGGILLLAIFGVAVVVGLRRLVASEGAERLAIAAALAAFLAYAVAVGIDWMWELTIVAVVGITLLGLLTGAATARASVPRAADSPGSRFRRRPPFAVGIAALLVGWLIICAQAVPFLADVKVSDSQAAAREGDSEQALEDAAAARNIQPWAATPYLQLALVDELTGDYDRARETIGEAIERDPLDWRLWLVRARVETKAGEITAARRSLERAAELNPRSPLFANVS